MRRRDPRPPREALALRAAFARIILAELDRDRAWERRWHILRRLYDRPGS